MSNKGMRAFFACSFGIATLFIQLTAAMADDLTLFDLRQSFIPQAAETTVAIFPDIDAVKDDSVPGRYCLLTYYRDPIAPYTLHIDPSQTVYYPPTTTGVRTAFDKYASRITDFYTDSAICSAGFESRVSVSSDNRIILPSPPGPITNATPAHNIIITGNDPNDTGAQGVEMNENSYQTSALFFGSSSAPIYEYPCRRNPPPDNSQCHIDAAINNLGAKLNQYVVLKPVAGAATNRFGVQISDTRFGKINFKLTVTPKVEAVDTQSTPTFPPPNNSNLASQSPTHANNQFYMGLGSISWHVPECRPPSDPQTYPDYCSQALSTDSDGKFLYEGKFFYVSFPMHQYFADASAPVGYWDENGSNLIIDGETGATLYHVDLRNFLPSPSPNVNPFEDQSVITHPRTLQTYPNRDDLKSLLNRAVQKLYGLQNHAGLPPMICTNKTNSTKHAFCDGGNYTIPYDDYLSHFYIQTVSINYEVSGLSQLGYKINNFTITASPPP